MSRVLAVPGLPRIADVGGAVIGVGISVTTRQALGSTPAPTPAPTPAILTAPFDAANGSTAMTGTVTTDRASGTLYWFISTSATPPAAANLKAAVGAVAAGSQAVVGTGDQNIADDGLTGSTAYFTHYLHTNAGGDSNIATADGFTTAAGFTDPPTALVDWRMPATVTTSSGLSAQQANLAAASAASSAKTRPSVTVPSSATEYIEWAVGESGTALLSWLTTTAHGTFTLTKNGVDLGWSNPSPGGSQVNMRMFVRVPVAAGDLLRLTCAAGASSRSFAPLLHKIPATGGWDAHVMIGASREVALHSTQMENAVIASYPARDPVVFNHALGGSAANSIAGFMPAFVTAYTGAACYALVGNIIGNDVSNTRPYDGSEDATIEPNIDTIMNAIDSAGAWPVLNNTSFRHYTGTVTPAAQSGGSLPYNDNIIHPKILEHAPESYDTALKRSRIDEYSAMLFNRNLLDADGVHGATNPNSENWVNFWFARLYDGAWPKAFIEQRVELAELTRTQPDINEATWAVSALEASAAKSALEARLAALIVRVPKVAQVRFGSTTGVAGFNSTTGGTTAGTPIANLLDPNGSTTGWSLGVVNAGTSNSFTAGAGSTHPRFPRRVGEGYVGDSSNQIEISFGGLNAAKTYNIIVFGSLSGTGTRNVDYSVNGGAVQTLNVYGNLSTALTFSNVAPSSGAINLLAARGSGNTSNVYINGVIVEENP